MEEEREIFLMVPCTQRHFYLNIRCDLWVDPLLPSLPLEHWGASVFQSID